MATSVDIPKRSLFKPVEVCAIAKVQPYVLRSWETEFPGLGTDKGGGARVYRRGDVERVLEIKRLLYEEGLTLGAARRKLEGSPAATPEHGEPTLGDLLGRDARERILEVKAGLQSVLALLSSGNGSSRGLFDDAPQTPAAAEPGRRAGTAKGARAPRAAAHTRGSTRSKTKRKTRGA